MICVMNVLLNTKTALFDLDFLLIKNQTINVLA